MDKVIESKKFLDSALEGLAQIGESDKIGMFWRDLKEVDNIVWSIVDCMEGDEE